jgi:hypothetical protein
MHCSVCDWIKHAVLGAKYAAERMEEHNCSEHMVADKTDPPEDIAQAGAVDHG